MRSDQETERKDAKKNKPRDPNVEYLDVDDFRPGGKHGPPKVPVIIEELSPHDEPPAAPTTTLPLSLSSRAASSLASKTWAELL
mmetsp:Transcript_7839/g.25752  ORF Transcript_7839/g.25752 Transcript_7839/m.25752 type:complete len:84 (+) Transcript_7839:1484-1735(+)